MVNSSLNMNGKPFNLFAGIFRFQAEYYWPVFRPQGCFRARLTWPALLEFNFVDEQHKIFGLLIANQEPDFFQGFAGEIGLI